LRTALFIGVFVLYIVMQLISGWMQNTYGLDDTSITDQQQIMTPQVPQQTGIIGNIETFISTSFTWIQTVWNSFWFHPEMFTGSWSMIWWIFFFPIGAAMAIGIIFVLRGVTNF
jgi:hypothetical protein